MEGRVSPRLDDKLELVELNTNEDFRNKICLPYFQDIYKDLTERSDTPGKGINKVVFLDYAQLPGVLGERFFAVMDKDRNGYLDKSEFITGLFKVFCSNFDLKTELIFEIYDFDRDGLISKTDILTIMSSLPVVNNKRQATIEGKFTQEGGGLDNFEQRVETMDEMNKILHQCFEGKEHLNHA